MMHKTICLYEGRKDVTLTSYAIEHSMEFLADVKRPAIVICPGGAYVTCSGGEGEPVAMTFNAMGYHAFVLRYSTYMQGKPGIPMPEDNLPVKEHCIFPRPMLDIRRAIQIIVEHADEWHVDASQIVLCGFSAGAHNCGIYSACWNEYEMPKPAAAILGYPVGDYRLQKWDGMDAMAVRMMKMGNIAIAGKDELDETDYSRLCISEHVDEATPPMFIWTTSEDEQVPAVQSIRIANSLARNHVPFELHVFERGPHGLSTANECSAVMDGQVRTDIEGWVKLAHVWLQKRLQVNLPDKMPF